MSATLFFSQDLQQSLCMKKTSAVQLVFLLYALLLLGSQGYAQTPHHFGVDFGKNFNEVLVASPEHILAEPVYLYKKDSSLLSFKISTGYNYSRRRIIYRNCDQKVQGYFVKPGVGLSWGRKAFYISFIYTQFRSENTFEVKGHYFSSYKHTERQTGLSAYGIEPNVDFKIPLKKRLSLMIDVKITVLLHRAFQSEAPAHYIPGVGPNYFYWLKYESEEFDAYRNICPGVSAYLLFN